jgi:hypothetical protein
MADAGQTDSPHTRQGAAILGEPKRRKLRCTRALGLKKGRFQTGKRLRALGPMPRDVRRHDLLPLGCPRVSPPVPPCPNADGEKSSRNGVKCLYSTSPRALFLIHWLQVQVLNDPQQLKAQASPVWAFGVCGSSRQSRDRQRTPCFPTRSVTLSSGGAASLRARVHQFFGAFGLVDGCAAVRRLCAARRRGARARR